jgi:hypothetical protein
MSKAIRILLPLVIIASAYRPSAFGWVRPSFELEPCVWDASHIVVVTMGPPIDGVAKVEESWKGDLKKGDVIRIPQLATFAPKEKRLIAQRRFQDDDDNDTYSSNGPTHVTCSRMILFLIREEDQATSNGKIIWRPASRAWKQMHVSVLWVEQKKVYGFVQQENPGPSELLVLDEEVKVSAKIRGVVGMQESLRKAMHLGDSVKMEKAMTPLVSDPGSFIADAAIFEVAMSGKKAVPLLSKLLRDQELASCHPSILAALAKSGGASVGPDLTAIVEIELGFWKKAVPGLRSSRWWNGDGLKWEEVECLRTHYVRTIAALGALNTIHYPGCRKVVTELRDFWRSQRQLEGDCSETIRKCDVILSGLSIEAPDKKFAPNCD